jgi:glycosyltransferase involved in cell wall biosynthesis
MSNRAQRRADRRGFHIVSDPQRGGIQPDYLPPTGGLRVLLLGDTAGTGFGTVTRDLAVAMVRRGIDVRLLSMNEDAGFAIDPSWPAELIQRTVLLGLPNGWLAMKGNDAAEIVKRAVGVFAGATIPGWVPETVLIVSDHASLEMSPWPKLIPEHLPAWNYVPIEGVDLPPSWGKLWERVKPVAMTNFGADQIEPITGERPPMVYHGVNPDDFWPVSGVKPLVIRTDRDLITLRSRAECRAFLGWPKDATIMFRADRMMPRKAFPSMFRALAPILATRNAVLFLHCRTIDQGGNLWHETSKYPDYIREKIGNTGFHDRAGGVPRQLLTAMYNAADLYISTSAEGFGLTVAESLACGTPAVALGYSSLPEVVGPAGVCVGDFALIDNIYSYFWAIPKGDGYTQAVDALVTDPAERRRLGALGPAHIAQFSWDTAAEQFEAILSNAPVPAARPVSPSRRMAAIGLVEART